MAVGILAIVSALTGPSVAQLNQIEDVDPAAPCAGVLAILLGVALVGLARGIRRGYRPAWVTVIALLAFTSFVLILKGVDIEEAVLVAAVAVWLLAEHRYFQVYAGRRRWWAWVMGVIIAAVLLAAALAAFFDDEERWTRNLTGLAIGVLVLVAIVVARRGRFRIRTGRARRAADRARSIIERHGGDTLGAFAIRPDRALLFSGQGVVAYSVHEGTMIVSPRPDLLAGGARRHLGGGDGLRRLQRLGGAGGRGQPQLAHHLPRRRAARHVPRRGGTDRRPVDLPPPRLASSWR